MLNSYRITNGRIILKDSILDHHDLVVENNIITAITQDPDKYRNLETIDADRAYISPGFVEQHFHGCGTYGFDILAESDLYHIIDFLKARGINTFVPTFQWNEKVVNDVAGRIKESAFLQYYIPGIYIEGPFISKEKKGGISADYIRDPDLELLKKIIHDTRGLLKLMTIAPEKEGSRELFDCLNQNGIVPCFGHSNCEIKDVFLTDQYKTSVTHLFNAMSPVSHQKSGLAMFPFLNRNTFFELNGDGVHVNDEAMKICYSNLNKERLILTSDAVVSAGLEYGEYISYSRPIVSNEKGVRYKENHVLMGSNLLVNDILKRFIRLTGAPVWEAVRFVSYNPCVLLGIDDRRGSIETGKEADLILLDQDYNVIRNFKQAVQ
jgi:N-acetylglucosamine-6-phosphate deacetylase